MAAEYLGRYQESRLLGLVERHPVVVLTGARQTGKTTLLRHLFAAPEWHSLTLDDLDTLEQARLAPDDLMSRGPRLTIDEVQYEPRLLSAIKRVVDRDRDAVRLVLSGSANLLLMHHVAESLAGRAVYTTLAPLTLGERLGLPSSRIWERFFDPAWTAEWRAWIGGGRPLPVASGVQPTTAFDALFARVPALAADDLWGRVWRGGLPALLHVDDVGVPEWFDGYEKTYLERDVLRTGGVSDLVRFRRTLRLAALQGANLVNLAALSREVGLSAPTVGKYLEILEISMLGHLLPAFGLNRRKRLIRTPKFFLGDSGLACHLCGLSRPSHAAASPLWGALLETWVFQHLSVQASLLRPAAEVFYWRSSDNKEVDFVLEWNGRLVAVEVKATRSPGARDASGLAVFRDEYPDLMTAGLLLHAGDRVEVLGDRLFAVPLGVAGA
jgi:predicted AAA+ superfamily ATPase